MTTQISDYRKSEFSSRTSEGGTITHDVYSIGTGAPIVLIQELPGIGQATLKLADKFLAEGFEVVLPHLFGPLGKVSMLGNLARVFCMRKEFSLFAANKSSPIVDWLKALCQQLKTERKAKGVGVIGMCLTGNFAISLMADESVLASVSSQPSMPLNRKDALHMSTEEVGAIKAGIDASAPSKAYRFDGDPFCNDERFNCIHDAFNNDGKERIQLNVLPGKGHSVLTLDFVDDAGHPTHNALAEIIEYFSVQLR